MPPIIRRALNIALAFTNCSQTELAALCGFSQSTLSMWVNGKYTGDQRIVMKKFRQWIERTYPELEEYVYSIGFKK